MFDNIFEMDRIQEYISDGILVIDDQFPLIERDNSGVYMLNQTVECDKENRALSNVEAYTLR